MNRIDGTAGNDTLTGTRGDDDIRGFGGDDVIRGEGGNDRLDGGAGNDTIRSSQGNDIIYGGAGNDTIYASDGANLIYGGEGDDIIFGSGFLDGGSGNNTLYSGGGATRFIGGSGADRFVATSLNNILDYSNSVAAISNTYRFGFSGAPNTIASVSGGDADNDTLGFEPPQNFFRKQSFSEIIGSQFDDDLIADTVHGGDGNDLLRGNIIYGGNGDDIASLSLRLANPDFFGGEGNDTLVFTVGVLNNQRHLLIDLEDNGYTTRYRGEDSSDVIYTGQLFDVENITVHEYMFVSIIRGDDKANIFISSAHSDDIVTGRGGDDTISLGFGNDIFVALANDGADTMDGGGGTDFITYADAGLGLQIDLLDASRNSGAAEGDTFANIEVFELTAGNDLFSGDTGNNFVYGGDGNDALAGAGGGDILVGGGGNDFIVTGALSDIVLGGSGADTFYYTLNQIEQDQILDFTTGEDVLAFEDSGFGLAAGTQLVEGVNFISTTSAAGASYSGTGTVFIYYSDLGHLYADTDGAGSGAANLIAVFGGGTVITASDLIFVDFASNASASTKPADSDLYFDDLDMTPLETSEDSSYASPADMESASHHWHSLDVLLLEDADIWM